MPHTIRPIHTVELFRYTLPLREALTTQASKQENAMREGLLVVLRDGEDSVGIGEIAPLPGLHRESLAEVEAQTVSKLALIRHESTDAETMLSSELLPSVRCGLEMALISLRARQNGTMPSQSPQANVMPSHLPLNALITGDSTAIVHRAEKAVREGYTTLKIKVGRASLEEDIVNVRACREAVGNDIALRLDANRSWSLETALRLGEALHDCNIAYIEEPLKDWRGIPAFHEQTGISVALDEMLTSPDVSERAARTAIPSECLAGYVLKPSAIGSITGASNLASEAEARGLDAVVSSVFETGVALGFYAALAVSWNDGRSVACGLDTYKFLAADVLEYPFSAAQGFVSLPNVWNQSAFLRTDFLKKVL